MRLENIKKLTEARYAGREVYFVGAFDPEDGQLDTFAGPFNNKATAENFAHNMAERDKREFKGKINPNDFPTYNVEKMLNESDFAEAMYNHIEVFAN